MSELRRHAAQLIARSGLGSLLELTPLPGGGNNQVYRANTTSGLYLLKSYFRHADDPRDRLGTEAAFAEFAWSHGLRQIAQPLAFDSETGLGLHEFISGRTLRPDEVDAEAVDHAAEFFTALNGRRNNAAALRLPNASEACFSLSDHLACVERRIERLIENTRSTPTDVLAAEFVERELTSAWRNSQSRVVEAADASGLARDEPLAAADRCLSPSDFGFHNALRDAAGRLRFIDFEYAGWDDPAKLVCDFFCQPAVPVPQRYFERFTERIAAVVRDAAAMRRRIDVLLPIYRLKWCCILMNDFLPDGGRRRNFARSDSEVAERKSLQLGKARMMLASVTTE